MLLPPPQIVCHMMPDLPNVGWERDIEAFREFFENPAFRADGLKLYPTLVIRGKHRTVEASECEMILGLGHRHSTFVSGTGENACAQGAGPHSYRRLP